MNKDLYAVLGVDIRTPIPATRMRSRSSRMSAKLTRS